MSYRVALAAVATGCLALAGCSGSDPDGSDPDGSDPDGSDPDGSDPDRDVAGDSLPGSSDEPRAGDATLPADGSGDAADVSSEPSVTDPDVTAVALQIDGRETTLSGQALLTVHQDVDEVDVGIVGAFDADDFLTIGLVLPLLDEAMGEHHSNVSRPLAADSDNVINASLNGEDYYSRLGEVDFTLGADGTIQGTFSVSLASAEGLDPVFPDFGGDEVTRLTGTFTGDWLLSCYSRLPGHMTWVVGGSYCEDFEF